MQEMLSNPQQHRCSRPNSPLLQPHMINSPPVLAQTSQPLILSPPQPLRRRLSIATGLPQLQPRPRHRNANDEVPQRQPPDPARKGLHPTTRPHTPSPPSTPPVKPNQNATNILHKRSRTSILPSPKNGENPHARSLQARDNSTSTSSRKPVVPW